MAAKESKQKIKIQKPMFFLVILEVIEFTLDSSFGVQPLQHFSEAG
jgi:hypothetical protein